MNRYLFVIVFAVTFASCTSNPPATAAKSNSLAAATMNKEKGLLSDTAGVKQWLTGVIEYYTNTEDHNAAFDSMVRSFTKDYYAYKQEAINLDYSDSANAEEAFKARWQHKYNTSLAGGGGYIISAQDNGKCKVTTCTWMKNTGDAGFYKVVIEDLEFKALFHRDIKVIVKNGKLLIDDVLEYD